MAEGVRGREEERARKGERGAGTTLGSAVQSVWERLRPCSISAGCHILPRLFSNLRGQAAKFCTQLRGFQGGGRRPLSCDRAIANVSRDAREKGGTPPRNQTQETAFLWCQEAVKREEA
eukprot:3813511-Rhodomonas_salina.1